MKKLILKSFIAILIFNEAFLISAKAQIVYTDVNSDTTVSCSGSTSCSKHYFIDVNMDGTNDFELNSYHYGSIWTTGTSYGGVNAIPLNGNRILIFSNYPAQLNLNTLINSTSDWNIPSANVLKGTSHIIGTPTVITGNWLSSGSHYLGFKLFKNSNIFYGWIQLSVGAASFTLQSYAYNSIPNLPILAGQTTCTTPTVTLTPSGSLKICQGDNVTLTATGPGYLYQWKKNGANISGAIQQTYIAKTAGTYNVIVTNSCGSQASNSAIVTVGLPCKNSDASLSMTSDALEHLSVYPNPATNFVTIKIPSDETGEISIVNLFGRVVETHNYASLRNGELQIDVSQFPAAMHVVRWSSGENYETKTFSVIK